MNAVAATFMASMRRRFSFSKGFRRRNRKNEANVALFKDLFKEHLTEGLAFDK
jgi:hypothetical protein